MWTVKHAPKTLAEFVGNSRAKAEFLDWLKNWSPNKRWALLVGPPGVGKTTLVYLAAKAMGMDVVEINRENIGAGFSLDKLAEAVSTSATLLGAGRKMVLVEEVEVTLGGFSDTERFFEVLNRTRVPVVFTMNDQDALYSNRKLYPLRGEHCVQIRFEKVRVDQIEGLLDRVCRLEGVKVEKQVLRVLAENAEGDVRAALNDLQAVCTGEEVVREGDIDWVSRRDTQTYAYRTVLDVIRSQSIYTAKDVVENSLADWDTIFVWLVENLPAYPKPLDSLGACCEALSQASIYKYRAYRFRIYEQMKFAEDFVCYAPQALGDRPFRKLEFPLRLKYLSRSREMRLRFGAVFSVLSKHLHTYEGSPLGSDIPFVAFFAQNSRSFYDWFGQRFGEENAKTLLKLRETGGHEPVE